MISEPATLFAGETWFDPIQAGIRERVAGEPKGYRHGARERHLLGAYGPVEISVPRARQDAGDGGTREWR